MGPNYDAFNDQMQNFMEEQFSAPARPEVIQALSESFLKGEKSDGEDRFSDILRNHGYVTPEEFRFVALSNVDHDNKGELAEIPYQDWDPAAKWLCVNQLVTWLREVKDPGLHEQVKADIDFLMTSMNSELN